MVAATAAACCVWQRRAVACSVRLGECGGMEQQRAAACGGVQQCVMACNGMRYGNGNVRICVQHAEDGGRQAACGGRQAAAAMTETAMRRRQRHAAICGSSPSCGDSNVIQYSIFDFAFLSGST
jgi:hypothetical protein